MSSSSAVGQQAQIERVDSVGMMIDAMRSWPVPSNQTNPVVDKSEREKRRRVIAQAHSKLCGDLPSLGDALPTDYLEFCVIGGIQKTVHLTDLKGFVYHSEMISLVLSRAVNGLKFRQDSTGDDGYVEGASSSPNAIPSNDGVNKVRQLTTPNESGVPLLAQIFEQVWNMAFEPINEKKLGRDEIFAVQAAALAACNSMMAEAVALVRSDAQRASRDHIGKQAIAGNKWLNNLRLLGLDDAGKLDRYVNQLNVSLRTSGTLQRYEKRGLTTGKDEFENRLEGLALFRTQLIEVLMTFHRVSESTVSVTSITTIVAESGYKSRDFTLSRTALSALASCNDLNAILSLKERLPAVFDARAATEPETKATMKAAWQTSAVGTIQLWDEGTAIALGSVCVKAMKLVGEQSNAEVASDFPPEFLKAFSIVMHHPRSSVFLAVFSRYIDTLTAFSLNLCSTGADPLYGGTGRGGGPSSSLLDFSFDRLLGAVGGSKVEILATLGMVECFADRVFAQNQQISQRSTSEDQRLSGGFGFSANWFASLPNTLGSIWEKFPENPGLILAATRVWGALLLLEQCAEAKDSRRFTEPTSNDGGIQDQLESYRDPTENQLRIEEAAQTFFTFLTSSNVFRQMHIRTAGGAIFDAVDHFIALLSQIHSHRNLPPADVEALLRMVMSVIVEAAFIGDLDSGSHVRTFTANAGRHALAQRAGAGQTVRAKVAETLGKFVADPQLADYKSLAETAAREIVYAAKIRGSQQLAMVVQLTIPCE